MKRNLESIRSFRCITIAVALVTILASGCAGISITPLPGQTPDETLDPNYTGYIVYEPMVVFPVMQTESCEKDTKNCVKLQGCTIGQPFTLPNYRRPYAIDIHSGFGKAGVELAIADGWRLSSLKDSSDNTEILKLLASATGIKAEAVGANVCLPGLYRLLWSEGSPSLKRIDTSDLMKGP